MSDGDRMKELLEREADSLDVDLDMPRHVRTRIWRRQGAVVAALSLSVVALVATASVFRTDLVVDRVPPADGDRPARIVNQRVGRGTEGGKDWEMVWVRTLGGEERICLRVKGAAGRDCWELDAFGGMSVAIGRNRTLDRLFVFVKVPPDVHTVGIREIRGTGWAALAASDGDEATGTPGFFYRFFDKSRVAGIVEMDAPDSPPVEFSLRVTGRKTHRSSIGIAREAFPELSGLPGQKSLVASGDEAGGYSVLHRRASENSCLHLFVGRDDTGMTRCRTWEQNDHIQIAMGLVMDCSLGGYCGEGPDLPWDQGDEPNSITIVAGEVGPEVARIGLRDSGGTSFVQPNGEGGSGGSTSFFSSLVLYGFQGEIVAFDEDDNELQVVDLDPQIRSIID